MKKKASAVEEFPVLKAAELMPLPGAGKLNRRTVEKLAKALTPQNLKKLGLLAGGAVLAASAVGSFTRTQAMRLALSRELKKQLAGVNAQLEELQRQNQELQKKLDQMNEKND